MTFDEMAAQRDPLYRMKPIGDMEFAIARDWDAAVNSGEDFGRRMKDARDRYLFKLTIRALRNQKQPYYHAVARGGTVQVTR